MLKVATAALFLVCYALLIRFYDRKVWIVGLGAFVAVAIGALTPLEALEAINWNVIGIYIGMLFISEALIESKLLDYAGAWLVNHSRKASVALLLICAVCGVLSMLVENVAAVLIIAPIALAVSRRLAVDPVPLVIGCVLCANLMGAATMIGDTPSLLLAGHTGLRFTDFLYYDGHPSVFFAVLLAFVAGLTVLYLFFRRHDHASRRVPLPRVKSLVPGISLAAMIAALIVIPQNRPGIICLAFGCLAFAWLLQDHVRNERSLIKEVGGMDWGTALFLAFILMLVQPLVTTGVVDDIAVGLERLSGSSGLAAFALILGASVVLSSILDNVPYMAAMLGVLPLLAAQVSIDPTVLSFGLLIGASVGGNLTPIGASANIVGVELLRSRGHLATFQDFLRVGLPFTLVTLAVAGSCVWLLF